MKRRSYFPNCSFFVVLFIFLLTACSSGGGGGGSNGLRTGRFVDGPVSGLYYETATQAGQTDAQGTFEYRSGETVRFYVGDILIGEATGAALPRTRSRRNSGGNDERDA